METKKLTAKDLMIGDYVYRPDCYDKVVEVRKDTILGSDPLRGLIPIADLQPITLTAEILEKNGFKNIDTGLDCDGSNIYWKTNNGYSINTQDINLKFVHELQHAMRLCGINDKEIEL